ncbi:hypothetical protein [Pseudochryseolinea flava]|nr:hypothetical protein [Pseudochryseolinea flava]
MYNTTDKSYRQARAIKAGTYRLPLVYQDFVDWLSRQFNVSVLDFACETKETSKGLKQQLLYVIVERVSDAARLESDRGNDIRIAHEFVSYFSSLDAEARTIDPLKSNVFALNTDPYPEVIIAYRPLEEIEKKIVDEKIKSECHAVIRKYGEVWTMSDNVIFFYTDQQVMENQINGEAKKLLQEILSIMKKYDEFGYFGTHSLSFRFDSKESFDRDFQGNWYYYWK